MMDCTHRVKCAANKWLSTCSYTDHLEKCSSCNIRDQRVAVYCRQCHCAICTDCHTKSIKPIVRLEWNHFVAEPLYVFQPRTVFVKFLCMEHPKASYFRDAVITYLMENTDICDSLKSSLRSRELLEKHIWEDTLKEAIQTLPSKYNSLEKFYKYVFVAISPFYDRFDLGEREPSKKRKIDL